MDFLVILALLAAPIVGTILVRRRVRRQVRFYESN